MRWTVVDEINETEGNKNETWLMKCGLKEMIWNINSDVWTDGNKMKHEQSSVDWRKLDETWTMKLIM